MIKPVVSSGSLPMLTSSRRKALGLAAVSSLKRRVPGENPSSPGGVISAVRSAPKSISGSALAAA
jgi:hypothetical protein